ncbi:hypothetical protein, partial [Pseudomonas sp. GW460-8]|uniref:hypothetical protein n=1 Tax=Pseudomonas sp. GW460-8 TaxID=2070608 RepID=UPI000CAD8EF7
MRHQLDLDLSQRPVAHSEFGLEHELESLGPGAQQRLERSEIAQDTRPAQRSIDVRRRFIREHNFRLDEASFFGHGIRKEPISLIPA